MKIYSNVTDPKKKKKSSNSKTEPESETGAIMQRDKKGTLTRVEGKNYQGQTNEKIRESRDIAAGTGSGSYGGGVAPKVGSDEKYKSIAANLTGGTKKQMRQSKKNVKNNSASPQAKKSAKKLY